jgi:hypothetical protein
VIHPHLANTPISPTPPSRQAVNARRAHPIQREIATQPLQEALWREGRMDLAKDALRKGQFKSVSATSNYYDVYRETLRDRIYGK